MNERVFRFLEGRWSVRRHFEGSYEGSFSGEAFLAPVAGEESTYRYTEQGKLTDGEGKQFDAGQSYLYRLAEGKLRMLKRGEPEWVVMHDLEFREDGRLATATHSHLCGQDHYTATYRIDLDAETWEVAYDVTGPKKDYRIRSVYSRA